MSKSTFRVLAINPGSTSTKAAVYDGEQEIASVTIRYAPQDFEGCQGIIDQKDLRASGIAGMLAENGIDPRSLDAVVGRGGLLRPIPSGTYLVNARMLADLHSEGAASHASTLGGLLAHEIGRQHGIPAYIVDPVVVDEMEPCAKLSGLPGIKRRSIFHALNAKATARRCARELGLRYEDARFIVAHMGGGISVSAHRGGQAVDVNDALFGDGPFSPERSGSLPLGPVVDLCFSGRHTHDEVMAMVNKNGGVKAYLGTNDMAQAHRMAQQGSEDAALVLDAMAYQISKEIGAMAAVLEGRVTAIILTGGLAHADWFTGKIRQRVEALAPVRVYPGEDEMLALAQGALRVLTGQEQAAIY